MSNRRKLRARLISGEISPWAGRPGRTAVAAGDGQGLVQAAGQAPVPPVPLRIPPRGRGRVRGRPRSFRGN